MKKSFFLSILAVGALVACSKSEVVDTKFDQAIGFEAYFGRAAQTRAAVTDNTNISSVGIFGFYTGAGVWSDGNTEGVDATEVNLMNNVNLTKSGTTWTYSPAKYWTNATDNYTFLAYAPYISSAEGAENPVGLTIKSTANTTLTYDVPTALVDQSDVIYSGENIDVTKEEMTSGTGDDAVTAVPFVFKHALSRLTVKASAAEGDFKFDVKEINISGNFNTKGDLTLATGDWANITNEAETYVFHRNGTVGEDGKVTYAVYKDENALSTNVTDYAGADKYLMMIPVNFSESKATLTVKYTTYYANQESAVNTKTFDVETNFEQGKAYAINLQFSLDTNNKIDFTVTVEDWKTSTTTGEGDAAQTDDHQQNENINA